MDLQLSKLLFRSHNFFLSIQWPCIYVYELVNCLSILAWVRSVARGTIGTVSAGYDRYCERGVRSVL